MPLQARLWRAKENFIDRESELMPAVDGARASAVAYCVITATFGRQARVRQVFDENELKVATALEERTCSSEGLSRW